MKEPGIWNLYRRDFCFHVRSTQCPLQRKIQVQKCLYSARIDRHCFHPKPNLIDWRRNWGGVRIPTGTVADFAALLQIDSRQQFRVVHLSHFLLSKARFELTRCLHQSRIASRTWSVIHHRKGILFYFVTVEGSTHGGNLKRSFLKNRWHTGHIGRLSARYRTGS